MFYGILNEKSEFLIFAALINPGDSVIDVGANIGMHTIASSIRVGHAWQVVSFQRDSRAYPLLEENIKINSLLKKIILRRLCLSDIEGKIRFYETDEHCMSGIFGNSRSKINQVTEYPVNTLDNELQDAGVNAIDQIKIDVEGSEAKVLKGAMGILGNSDAYILLEV